MTRIEQMKFVSSLMDNIKRDIQEQIQSNQIPENWDGLELRHYIVDKASQANFMRMDKKRFAAYRNVILVNDL